MTEEDIRRIVREEMAAAGPKIVQTFAPNFTGVSKSEMIEFAKIVREETERPLT